MKSKFVATIQSDGFCNDRDWWRVILVTDELVTAIEEGTLDSLIRSVLRPTYGTASLFQSLCNDVGQSARSAVAEVLKKQMGNSPGLAVLLDRTSVDKFEKTLEERSRSVPSSNYRYWIGESNSL